MTTQEKFVKLASDLMLYPKIAHYGYDKSLLEHPKSYDFLMLYAMNFATG